MAASQPISELMRFELARPELISMAAGFVDQQSLPVDVTREATSALMADAARGRAALQYGTNAGYIPLRDAVRSRYLAANGTSPATPVEQIVLTAGSNQLLHLVGEVLFDPGDLVLCAAPSYFVYLGLLAGLGVTSVGVASDDDGMMPQALEEELKRRDQAGELSRVKAIYVTSYFDNPSSVTLSLARRAAVVEIAKRWSRHGQIYVIDDTAYRLLRYAGDDLPSLRAFDESGDTVIVADTFSKSFSPGVRVGWGILPPALVEPVCNQKANIDFGSPNFNQHLMAEVLKRGLFEPHVDKLRASYRAKLSAMLEAMHEHLPGLAGAHWAAPEGGLYVWLKLDERFNTGPAGPLIAQALEEGVLYVPGEYCFPAAGERRQTNCIRLSFGVQNAANIRRGIELLARAIQRCLEVAAENGSPAPASVAAIHPGQRPDA
ncbi:MAG: PLP-dependent aminotransferase family protein [Pirellulales bacterium]